MALKKRRPSETYSGPVGLKTSDFYRFDQTETEESAVLDELG